MSHLSKIFESVPIKVQNKNGFDLSHLNCGTSKCGQLVPVMCKLLPPNSDFTLGINMEVNLPPLATNFFGRIDAIVEGFVVPCSILYGGWKRFISNQQNTMVSASQVVADWKLPVFSYEPSFDQEAGYTFFNSYVANSNILEYLGLRMELTQPTHTTPYRFNMLPMLAYHLIWDTYYRNKQVTKTIFEVNVDYANTPVANYNNVSRVWHSYYTSPSNIFSNQNLDDLTFPDGKFLWDTRQRNYARDYFTASTPDPQQGAGSKLKFDVANASGEFTISALRSANALQKFLETNNLSGDYAEMMRNRWGTRPIDADFDEPYYLGRVVVPVYQHSIYQQDSSAKSDAVNPFAKQGAIGVKGASAGFSGSGNIGKYHNTTWSYVMCLFSLVPHAMYSQGVNRELTMTELGDFPAPELQSVGNEAIKLYELYFNSAVDASFDKSEDFSYIPRYSRFKYMDDEVHAELRLGKSLDSFVLQRNLGANPTLSTAFLEIPQDALDDVFAVSTASMNLSCWYEIYFDFKVSMPLADFCIPTLGDIGDTHTIKTTQGGSRL